MDTIFSAFNLTPVVAFLAASGVLIVGIHLAFRSIQLSKKAVSCSDPVSCSFTSYDDSGVYFDADYSAVESFAEQHLLRESEHLNDSFDDFEFINPDFDPDFDFELESKYDAFAAAYYEAQRSAENPHDMDQWEFATELRGGLSLDEYLQVEGHQEFLKRYYSENPSDSISLDLNEPLNDPFIYDSNPFDDTVDFSSDPYLR